MQTNAQPTGIQDFKKGDLVTWYHRPAGTYGYSVPIEAVVKDQIDRDVAIRFFDLNRARFNTIVVKEKFLRRRMKRTDIYFTVGDARSYYAAIRTSIDGVIYKSGREFGRGDYYKGGVVFKTYADAKAEAEKHPGWEVFGIDPVLEWDKGLTDVDDDLTPGRRLRWDCPILILVW